eukprot:4880909-Heterocapsa_arctica.AAC.1
MKISRGAAALGGAVGRLPKRVGEVQILHPPALAEESVDHLKVSAPPSKRNEPGGHSKRHVIGDSHRELLGGHR